MDGAVQIKICIHKGVAGSLIKVRTINHGLVFIKSDKTHPYTGGVTLVYHQFNLYICMSIPFLLNIPLLRISY
ncbi:hypothetical protein FKM82_030395 [Ascaphus truei]